MRSAKLEPPKGWIPTWCTKTESIIWLHIATNSRQTLFPVGEPTSDKGEGAAGPAQQFRQAVPDPAEAGLGAEWLEPPVGKPDVVPTSVYEDAPHIFQEAYDASNPSLGEASGAAWRRRFPESALHSIPKGAKVTVADSERFFEEPEVPITSAAQMKKQIERTSEVLANEKAFDENDHAAWDKMESKVPAHTESRGMAPGHEPGTVFVATREDVPKEGSSEEPAVDPTEAGATAEFLWGCPACGSRTRGKLNKCRHCGSLRICKNLGPDGEEFFNTVGYTKLHDETRYGVGKPRGTRVAEDAAEHSAEHSDAAADLWTQTPCSAKC